MTTEAVLKIVEANFANFLLRYRTSEGVQHYVKLARTMREYNSRTLLVDYSHMSTASSEELGFDVQDLQQVVQKHFLKIEPALVRGLYVFLRSIDNEMTQWVDATQTSTGTGAASSSSNRQLFGVAFFNMGEVQSIRANKTEHLGQLVAITGTVTRTTEVKPELVVGAFSCPMCRQEVSNVVQQFKFTEPTVCANAQCGNRRNWELLPDNSVFTDWQKIKLQEANADIPPGSMPRSLDVIVRKEECDRVKAGDAIVATGVLIVVPEIPALMKRNEVPKAVRQEMNKNNGSSIGEGFGGLKDLGVRELNYKICFLAQSIVPASHASVAQRSFQQHASLPEIFRNLTASQRARLQALNASPDVFALLASAVAPAVHGHLEIKKGLLLMLVGGLAKGETGSGSGSAGASSSSLNTPKLRGDLNVLIIGDPATAKSEFLKWTSKLLPRSIYTSGKSSTAAGLTASVSRDPEVNELTIEPGALILADTGLCCIDEFDQMDGKDVVAIHEAMEQQTISISKAGINATMNARCSVVAAANPRFGRYDQSKTLQQNINLTGPIMSRFDLMFVVVDRLNNDEDRLIAEHILDTHITKLSGGDAAATLTGAATVSEEDLVMYIQAARTHKPKISEGARRRVIRYYTTLRQAEKGVYKQAYRVTVRQLESLIRLSEALARIYWSDVVKPEHVDEAYALLKSSIQRVEQRMVDIGLFGETDEAAPAEAGEGEGEEAEQMQQDEQMQQTARRAKKVKIGFAEYERITRMLAMHIEEEEREIRTVTEEELIAWYLLQYEASALSEQHMTEMERVVELVIDRLINKDHILLVLEESPDITKPKLRVLTKHPNFVVDTQPTYTHMTGDSLAQDSHAPHVSMSMRD